VAGQVAAQPAPAGDPDATALAEWRAALQITPDRQRGEQLFATCAACHGTDGMGQPDGGAQPGGGTQAGGGAPVIAGQYREVLLRQLVDYRHGQRWDMRMEHVMQLRRLATVDDLADVAGFIAALPVTGTARTGDGRNLATGATVYLERCAACHGATGQGVASRGVTRLAAQHHPYLYRQFFDVVEGRRPSLSASHGRLMSDLDQAQADGIADYLSRMQVRPPASPSGGRY
jgi:cytochrome c553